MKKVETLEPSDRELIKQHKNEMLKFFEQLSNLMDIRHSQAEKEAVLRYLKSSFLEEEELIKPVQAEKRVSELEMPPSKEEINSIKTKALIREEIDIAFQEYSQILLRKWKSKRTENQKGGEPLSQMPVQECDQQEICIMSAIENYLIQGQYEEAKRLIKWRKNLLAIAQNCGWIVAKKLCMITASSLEITHLDFLKVSLELMEDKKDIKKQTTKTEEENFFELPAEITLKHQNKSWKYEKYSADNIKDIGRYSYSKLAVNSTVKNMAFVNSVNISRFEDDMHFNKSGEPPEQIDLKKGSTPQKNHELKMLIDKADGIKNLSMQIDTYLKLRPSTKNLIVYSEKI